jgi:hypothetical protein
VLVHSAPLARRSTYLTTGIAQSCDEMRNFPQEAPR